MGLTALARRVVKGAVLPAGVLRARRPGDLVVLLYHRVGVEDGEISLRREAFDRQMEELARAEHPVRLDEALTDETGGGVVVTFDDGYRDFYEHALPVLERHRVPAVLYLATGLVAGEGPKGRDALTWSDLGDALTTGLLTIGSHTHSHEVLLSVDQPAAEEEMRRSKELIEDRLGVECRHFAYPFAVGSPAADRAARKLFDSAALGAWVTNRAGRIDPYRLGRTPILRSDSPLFFRAKVKGKLDGEGWVYRALGRGPWRWR